MPDTNNSGRRYLRFTSRSAQNAAGQVKATEPAVQVERAGPQLLGELPRACQKRAHTSRNVQPERENVPREMLVSGHGQEVGRRIQNDR